MSNLKAMLRPPGQTLLHVYQHRHSLTQENVQSARECLPCARTKVEYGQALHSSRKIVPLFATSKSPCLVSVAPVNAPFSNPNSSLSRRSRGMAAQFKTTKG